MQPELTQAFITALTGNPDTVMDWRVINDRDKAEQARNLRGTLTERFADLKSYNEAGWGVFACINALDGQGQTLDHISHIRTQVADLDNVLSSNASYQQAVNSALPPHVAVQSSPNKFHLYWFTQPYTGNDFYTSQQRKFAQLYDGDKSIVDATRVMRVPGFYHCKGEPVMVTCWQVSNNDRYTAQQIEAHLQHVNVVQHIGSRSPLGTKEMQAPSLEWLVYALNLRDPNSLERGDWMSATAAFKQSGWNLASEETLLNIWQQWCAKYEANDNAENLKLWNSLKDTEVGWGHFRRVTPVNAYVNNSGNASKPEPSQLKPQTQVTDTSQLPEILDTEGKKLWFKDCFFVESVGKVFTLSGRFMDSTKFNGTFGGKQFSMSGNGSKVVNEPWQAALRATDWTVPKVDHVRFLPECKLFEVVEDSMGRKGLNTYIPPKVEIAQGDVSLWLTHLEKMLPVESDRRIFCSYLAHCVKFPGSKIPWAILLQSQEGAGKTIFKDVIQYALGEMYTYSPQAPELASSGSKFNAWMRSKLAIIVDEVKVDERRDLIEILKPMITDARVEVQGKGVDQQMEDNCANWIFFSNHKDAIPVSRNGRRYAVFFSPLQNMRDLLNAGMDDNYFANLRKWYLHQGGLSFITHWLMNYPVERGGLPGRAPKTSSHAEALRIGRSPLEVLLDDKIDNAEYGFRNGYVSYTMFVKAIEASRIRNPAEYIIRSILEMRGYYEAGYYTHILTNEDFGKPPLIFSCKEDARVEDYETSQL